MTTEARWGGRRNGAGRKQIPAGDHYVRLTLRLPPDLARDLDRWESMYYRSRADAIKGAIDLWAGLWDAGIWRNDCECMSIAAEPIRLLARRLSELTVATKTAVVTSTESQP